VTLLKQETLFSVIDAAIDAGLECEALLLSIPRDAQSSLVTASARSSREQYLSILSQLNDWRARGREEPPLRTLVHSMLFLVGMREQAHVFQKALAEIDSAPSKASEQGELLFTRTKDCYVERGFRVIPPVDAPLSLTFQAWRGGSAVSVIGVAAVAPLEVVIEAVRKLVEQLAPQERVEGYVVLFTDDSRAVEQVLRAGLVAVPYKELARMGVREITAFVDRQQAALAQEADSFASGENDDVRRELRAALRESSVRVVMVRARTVPESARRIVLSLTRDYLRNPARAAPVLLHSASQPCEFRDLVAAAFSERRVPFSRFDFPGLLAEGAFLPVFEVDSRQCVLNPEGGANAAHQVLATGGKVVLVVSEERAVTPQELARCWKLRPRDVRTLSARGVQTKDPAVVILPRAPVGTPKTVGLPRFEQGRALLVGVANYPLISRLPESVLNDARDIAALLQSPARCGYPETNVELLLDKQATAQRFRLGLQRLAQQARPDDTVIVFFSGHGFRSEPGSDGEAYLLPFDGNLKNLARTALSASELTRLLTNIKASRLVVLLDACHAAGAAYVKAAKAPMTFKAGLDDRTYDVLGRGTGRVVMASCRANEESSVFSGEKNSLFTTYLLEALDGTAASRDDDVIRVLDVFHHVSENVPRRASQHPILKAQDVENNFPIALNLRNKQASSSRGNQSTPLPIQNGHAASALPPKARLAIRSGLIRRWDDLAIYFGIPLLDRARFEQGYEGQRTLEWLEERGRLDKLREAFTYLGWSDLVAELDRHSL
jgi:hypothetical protein